MADWFYTTGGKQAGPIDQTALLQLLNAGTLPPDTLVWQPGMEIWSPANTLATFATASAPTDYQITPVVPRVWIPKAERELPPAPRPRKSWFRKSKPPLVAPPASIPKPKAPRAIGTESTEFRAWYRMGFRHFACLILCVAVGIFLLGMAKTGRSLVLDYVIHFSPSGARIFFVFLAGCCFLGATMMAVGLFFGLFPPWRLKLTDKAVIIPRTFFFGSKSIPLSSIRSFTERLHRGRPTALKIRTTNGNYSINPFMFSRRSDYDFVKRSLMGNATSSQAFGAAPRSIAHPVTTQSRSWYRRPRFSSAGLTIGLVFIAGGGYFAFLGYQSNDIPTVVPIAEFERHPPDNRNVIITGGYFNPARGVRYRLYHTAKDTNPDITYFVPLTDGPGQPARVVVKISDTALKSDKNLIHPDRLHVMRLTQFDFDGVVRDKMRQSFGDAVDNMIVVQYGGEPGMVFGLVLMSVGGFFLLIRNKLTG